MNRLALFRTLLYGLGFIALGLVTASLGPTLPALAAQTNASTGTISRVFIARAIGSMIGALWLGKLYDKRGGHPVLGGALLLAALLMALIPQCSAVLWLFVVLIFVGIASASINVGGNILILAAHGKHVGPYINGIHFAFGLGGFFAPVLAKQFAQGTHPLQWTYFTLAALIALIAVLIMTQPSPPLHHSAKAQTDTPINYAMVALLALYLFLEVGAEGTVSGWLFTYAQRLGAPQRLAYDSNSGFWAAFTLGRLASIPLAMRLRDRTLVLLHLSGWLILTAVLLALPPALAATPGALWSCALGMGLAMAPIFPTMLALGQRRLHASGKVTGWLLFGASLGGMFWPWLVGQQFDRHGARGFLWCIAACLIGAISLFLWWEAKTRPAETALTQTPDATSEEAETTLEPL